MAVGLADESSQLCLVAGKIQIAHKVMFMIFPKKCQTKATQKTLQSLTRPLMRV
jgi:hypothetical protein